MHQKGKIAGMDIRVGHSTIVMNMLVEEIMFAVLLEVLTCSVVSVIYTNGCKQPPPPPFPFNLNMNVILLLLDTPFIHVKFTYQ